MQQDLGAIRIQFDHLPSTIDRLLDSRTTMEVLTDPLDWERAAIRAFVKVVGGDPSAMERAMREEAAEIRQQMQHRTP